MPYVVDKLLIIFLLLLEINPATLHFAPIIVPFFFLSPINSLMYNNNNT